MYKPAEIEYISKKYRMLYANRIDFVMQDKFESKKVKKIEKGMLGNEPAYKPALSFKTH